MSKQFSENGFTYTVDENGTITGDGQVSKQGVKCGNRVTPGGMIPNDQRGHVIGAQQGGVNKDFNMTAQNGKLNQGAYKTVENSEVNLARQGNDVHTSKTAYVSNQPGNRPDAYMTNTTITTPDGKTQSVHLSFQNMDPDAQEAQNQAPSNMDIDDSFPNPDPLRDSMSKEEHTALMEETDAFLPSVKDEFDIANTTQMSFDQEANNTIDTDNSTSNDTTMDSGDSSGQAADSDGQSEGDGCDTGGCDSDGVGIE